MKSKIKVGEILTIKTYDKRPDYWIPKMSKYMGHVTTVIDIRPNGSIKIAEDQHETEGGWHWKECNFTK